MTFYKTELLARQLESFCAHQDEICAALSQYSDCVSAFGIRELCDGFRRKTADFFRENRKYNVAVIGQVKAGKTSFLNTLFFEGEEVLPKDAMPKTAALTRIEYAPENSIEVEYYSPEDWVWLKKLAASHEDSDRARAAAETVIRAETSGLPVQELIFKGTDVRGLDSVGDLHGELDSFVGENGFYTPLVKSATLKLALEPLRDISVVDTPGLNDPIASRTQRTREFIETCDAAFFLSRAGFFLDKNDVELLTSALPRKGVRRLVLMASQFDSAVMDLIYDCESVDEASALAKKQLDEHAALCIDAAVGELRREGCPANVLAVAEQCKKPVYFSAMAEDIARKPRERCSEQERVILDRLGVRGELTGEKLAELGNMAQVRALFRAMVDEKDSLLERKAAAMAAVGQSDLTGALNRMKEQVQGELEGELKVRRDVAAKKLSAVAAEVNSLRDDVGAVYMEYLAELPPRLSAAGMNLAGDGREWDAASQKRAVEVETQRRRVSDSVFYKPWTWGSSHEEVSSTERGYTYMDPADMIESLRQAANEAELLHDAVFEPFADTSRLCNRLAAIAGDDMAGKAQGEAADIGRWVRIAKSRIVIPRIKVDPAPYIAAAQAKFPREIRTQAEQERFSSYAAETMGSLIDGALRQLEGNSEIFRESARNSEERFCSLLLADRAKLTAELRAEISGIDAELARRRELLEMIEGYI